MTPSRPLSPEITHHRGALSFSTPLRLGAVAVLATAAIALGSLLVPRDGVPIAGVSPSPTATVLPETASPEPSPTLTPTSTPTLEPTPTPTPVLPAWTGIAWSDPFQPFPHVPSVYANQRGTSTWLHAIMEWEGAFVGAGSISHGFQCEEAAFFRSANGVDWSVTARFSSGDEFAFYMCPDYLVSTPTGLLAIGQQRIWASTDGATWTEIDSPSWRAMWPSGLSQLLSVASGPAGVVVIGLEAGGSGAGPTRVVHSSDGRTWEQVTLPAGETPIVRDVATYPGGFVIVGRDGAPDDEASPEHPAIVPGIGTAAAWMSADGVTWTESSVEAISVQGGGMTELLVGANGLFAVGINDDVDYYPAGLQGSGEVVTTWASADGSSWTVAGVLGEAVPPMGRLASDGTLMVGLGLRQASVGQDPTAWASTDGQHWSPLAVSGPAPDVGYLYMGPRLVNGPPDSALWVLADGMLALGPGDGVPIDEPNAGQWFRFAAAVTR